jgi:hypothetical protein
VNWKTFAMAGALLFGGTGTTMAEMRKIEFKEVAHAPSADTLRLTRGQDGVYLAVSKTVAIAPVGASTTISAISLTASGSAWNTMATLGEVVPAVLKWDVTMAASGQPEIVYERPGGAVNALLHRNASGSTEGLTGAYPFKSFSDPRFTRPLGAPPQWATAVLDETTCVAVPLTPIGPYRTLGECSAGLLVNTGSGFVHLYKTNVQGVVRGNLTSPGRLHLATLDAALHPVGQPFEVFNGVVFEFDADVIDNKLVVLATTLKGIVIASGHVRSTGKLAVEEHPASTALTSPAIAAGASGKVFLAALDSGHAVRAEMVIP